MFYNIDGVSMRKYGSTGFRSSTSKRWKRLSVSALAVLLLFFYFAIRGGNLLQTAHAATGHGPYTTNFPLTENPISENGNWINGKTVGLDWQDVQTTPGFAFGTESTTAFYTDPTAVLSGTWGPDQTVQAKIHKKSPGSIAEVELRLRTTILPHKITGYEVNFSCSSNPSYNYSQIVRWNGPLGSFTGIGASTYNCTDGDVVKATMIGNTITVYVNNVQTMQTVDNTFTNGSPGMGFYLEGNPGSINQYGFTTFMATDGGTGGSPLPPVAPTNLTAVSH